MLEVPQNDEDECKLRCNPQTRKRGNRLIIDDATDASNNKDSEDGAGDEAVLTLTTTLYVSIDGNDASDGRSTETALKGLPAAAKILNANPHGGTIFLSAGVHTVDSASTFKVPFTLQGEGAFDSEIVSAADYGAGNGGAGSAGDRHRRLRRRRSSAAAAAAAPAAPATILKATADIAYTWMVLTPLNSQGDLHPGTMENITIADIRFDLAHVPHGSAVMLGFVRNVRIERCAIINVGNQGWAMHVGQLNPADNEFLTSIVNFDIKVDGCVFDGLDGTLEMILITNAENVVVQNSVFRNSAAGNAVGVYQWTENVAVVGCTFEAVKTALYYTRSCNNTRVDDCFFTDCQNGIRGALQSDNDCSGILGVPANEAVYPFCVDHSEYAALFGVRRAHNLTVQNSAFNSSRTGTPLEIGAVENARVDGCTFENNDNVAISISRGGKPVSEANKNIAITDSWFASKFLLIFLVLISFFVSYSSHCGSWSKRERKQESFL